eukprot:m.923085 g.923085  ORF g.923085 m.923085 type:complete len:332 (+) comp106196_c0_seq1:724-1719(+)
MTYWSRLDLISLGTGRSDLPARAAGTGAGISSRTMSLHSSMHSSQMKTDGPAISFLTSCWLLPQNEQYRTFSLEVPFLSAIGLLGKCQGTGGCLNDDSPNDLGALVGIRAPISLRIRGPVTPPHDSGPVLQHLVDQTVALGLGRRHEVVALGIRLDFLQGLACALGQDAIQGVASLQDFTRMDLNIRGLTLRATERLVDHDLGVGQREALALGAGCEQEGAHAGRHAHAQRRHRGLDEVHRVEDGHAGRHAAARAVDVERNLLVGVFALQEQHLRDDEVGDAVVDGADQKDDSLTQQARVDVVGALAPAGLFDDHGDQPQVVGVESAHSDP